MDDLIQAIERAYVNPDFLEQPKTLEAVHAAIDLLDRGEVRVAEKKRR